MINNKLNGKQFSVDEYIFEIEKKYICCNKNITELIITECGKHVSSIYKLGEIYNLELYGFDILLSKKVKKHYLLIFDNLNEKLGCKNMGFFKSSKCFIEHILIKIPTVKKNIDNKKNKIYNL